MRALYRRKLVMLVVAAAFGFLLLAQTELHAFYASEFGRWINRDPLGDDASLTWTPKQHFVIGGCVERVQRPNLFLVVRNSPLVFIDPYGQFVDAGGHLAGDLEAFWDQSLGCGQRIKSEVWHEHGVNRGNDDPSARLAHCIAHCRITRECFGGPATSWLGGLAKEIGDELTRIFSGKGDGYDSDDMAANALGRRFAKCKNKSCEEQCQGALKDGSLYPTTAPTFPGEWPPTW